jgi:hypothetical protein
MPAPKVCVKCHDQYDDDTDNGVHLTTVRDPDTQVVVFNGPLCDDHRECYAMDGYKVLSRDD